MNLKTERIENLPIFIQSGTEDYPPIDQAFLTGVKNYIFPYTTVIATRPQNMSVTIRGLPRELLRINGYGLIAFMDQDQRPVRIVLTHPQENIQSSVSRTLCLRAEKHSLGYLSCQEGRFTIENRLLDYVAPEAVPSLEHQLISVCQTVALSHELNQFLLTGEPYQFLTDIEFDIYFNLELADTTWHIRIEHPLAIQQGQKLVLLQRNSELYR